MAVGALQLPIEDIKLALSSPETCSRSVLARLETLLSVGSPKPKPTRQKETTAKRPSTKRKAETTSGAELSLRERFSLATDIINVTAKSLTAAAKVVPPKTDPDPQQPAKSNENNRRSTNVDKAKSVALKSRAVNRALDPKGKQPTSTGNLSKWSREGPNGDPGLTVVAECGHLAFCAIRSPEFQDLRNDLPALHVEHGMSAFIGRLLALKLDVIALKELRILRELLVNGETVKSNETLSSLLLFENIPEDRAKLALTCSAQMYALTLACRSGKSSVIETCCANIRLSSPSSPFRLISKSVSDDPSKAKALNYLASISRTLLDVESTLEDCLSPRTAFSVHVLALVSRRIWGMLSGKLKEIDKNVLESFQRALSSLTARNDLTMAKKYHQELFMEIGRVFDSTMFDLVLALPGYPLICKKFSQLFQDAGDFDEAILWAERAGAKDKGQTPGLALLLRKGIISLQRNIENGEKIEQISTELQKPICGDSQELLEIYNLVVDLRRQLAKGLSGLFTQATRDDENIIRLRQCLLQCVQFMIKYLEREKSTDQSLAIRTDKIAGQILGAADSILALQRESVISKTAEWKTLDGHLRLVNPLLLLLKDVDLDPEYTDRIDSILKRLSNLYWAFFSQHPNLVKDDSEIALKCLSRSTEVLSKASLETQIAAMRIMKLERYALLLVHVKSYSEAQKVYLCAVQQYQQEGTLKVVADTANRTAFSRLWSISSDAESCLKCISAFVNAASKARSTGYLDDAIWPLEERILLLETQLSLVGDEEAAVGIFQSAINLMKNNYPIRKARLSLLVTRFGIISLFPIPKNLAKDVYLERFRDSLSSTLSIVEHQKLEPKDYLTSLQSLHQLVSSCHSVTTLFDRFDYIDSLVTQLKVLADFADQKGNSAIHMLALQTLTHLLDLHKPQSTELIQSLLDLGQQYRIVGLTKSLGSLVSKTREISDPYMLSNWHLLYAEYYLELQDMEQCSKQLACAQRIAESSDLFEKSGSRSNRLRSYALSARAFLVTSCYLFQSDRPEPALEMAKHSVKLYHQAFNTISSRQVQPELSDDSAQDVCDLTPSVTHESWTAAINLFLALSNLAQLFEYAGMYQEATFYSLQAKKVVEDVGSNLVARSMSDLGNRLIRCGKIAEGEDMLASARQVIDTEKSVDRAKLHSFDAYLCRQKDERDAELLSYDAVVSLTEELIGLKEASGDDLTESLAQLSLTKAKSQKRPRARAPKAQTSPSTALRLKDHAACHKAEVLALQGNFKDAADLLSSVSPSLQQKFSSATLLLEQVLKKLPSDATLCVVQDSALAVPSVSNESTSDLMAMLRQAKDLIYDVQASKVQNSSLSEIHHISALLTQIMVLSIGQTHPLSLAYTIELPRIIALRRERAFTSHVEISGPSWPSIEGTSDLVNIDDFQERYINSLPKSWNVISLACGPRELYITKFRSGQSPFVLRVPLDQSEEQFGLEDALSEMQEIIQLANKTATEAKNMTTKAAKAGWWKERETLDERLGVLLMNIEKLWLGGFKGIFGRIDDVSRFGHSLQHILNRYLPSRRRKKGTLVLDPRVLELFLSLQPNDEEGLTDLIYFVVDILQFSGEHNSHDEIDFDAITVDCLALLKEPTFPEHTVLILDKALHSIPWESLPCLYGKSVTRVSSIECLSRPLVVERTGTIVLNPSGDLKTTEKTFKKVLPWPAIIGRPPTEEEMQQGLETPVFLYFGHGSGLQYIRQKVIRKLNHCAVAFLLGCSSGVLTECGEYEPHGTPLTYMQAGSPALLCTLWDVTDKDIDRFSSQALHSWLDGNDLGSAVADARSTCVLRYLNGAAPVIYGVPVCIKAMN
jgi:separase